MDIVSEDLFAIRCWILTVCGVNIKLRFRKNKLFRNGQAKSMSRRDIREM